MNLSELNEYLSIVVALEKEKYMQEKCIDEMRRQANSLQADYPEEIEKPIYNEEHGSGKGEVAFGCLILLTIIPAIIGVLGIIVNIFAGDFFGDLQVYLLLIAPCATIGLIGWIHIKRSDEIARETATYKYNAEMRKYDEDNQRRSLIVSRIDSDIRERKNAILSQVKIMEDANKKTSDILQKIYNHNIIFPKYRNLVMVCSLYEYISAGRCTSLEGHEGAYNILEMEVRLDRIILQLDQVLVKLSAIEQNQYILYSAVKESQNMIAELTAETKRLSDSTIAIGKSIERGYEQIGKSLSEIATSSAIISYTAQQSQKELHYMNRMNYLTGRNDGSFWNVPPN